MDEQQWLTSTDPQAMLELSTRPGHTGLFRLSQRKIRLYACGLCRLVWDGAECPDKDCADGYWPDGCHCETCNGTGRTGGLTDPRSRRAVEVAECYADSPDIDLRTAWNDAAAVNEDGSTYGSFGETHAAEAAALCVLERLPVARVLGHCVHAGLHLTTQADLLRCVAGNPFRPVRLWDKGRHPKKTKLEQLYPAEGQDWLFSPKMDNAIAVARAIYDGWDWRLLPILADALEDAGCDNADILTHLRGPGPHCWGCWAVDLVLGKE